jgi:hypothetical protein
VESSWARPDPAGAVERMRVTRKAQAAQFAANIRPIIRGILAAYASLNVIVKRSVLWITALIERPGCSRR